MVASESSRRLVSNLSQKLQEEFQVNINARQQLQAQQQENLAVKKEFGLLNDQASIFKVVGPVLFKQDRKEASLAVDGRLNFIETEIKRIEENMKDIKGQLEAE